jgi:hypothetical protein
MLAHQLGDLGAVDQPRARKHHVEKRQGLAPVEGLERGFQPVGTPCCGNRANQRADAAPGDEIDAHPASAKARSTPRCAMPRAAPPPSPGRAGVLALRFEEVERGAVCISKA